MGAPTNSAAGDGQSTIQFVASATLDLTGGITFAAGSDANLLLSGGIWTDTAVTGVAAGDTLDLENVFFDTLPDTVPWSDKRRTRSAGCTSWTACESSRSYAV